MFLRIADKAASCEAPGMKPTPCPFCNSVDLETTVGTPDREGTPTALTCADCGATGPWAYEADGGTELAKKRWNQRASTSQGAAS